MCARGSEASVFCKVVVDLQKWVDSERRKRETLRSFRQLAGEKCLSCVRKVREAAVVTMAGSHRVALAMCCGCLGGDLDRFTLESFTSRIRVCDGEGSRAYLGHDRRSRSNYGIARDDVAVGRWWMRQTVSPCYTCSQVVYVP